MKHLKIVEFNRSSKGKRFANYIIDLIIFYILLSLIFAFLILISPAFNGWLSNAGEIEQRLLSIASYAIYMFSVEMITGGRSVGKFITGTKVIMIDGTKPTFGQLLLRNIFRSIVLIDQLSFLGENGFHDSWSNTRVIDIKNYETERQAKSEIESIGTKEID
ncbi:RDD family protein [Chryseobacterium sp. PS-8]|uniref:RDD family protein n=1 Tax=Chryseobacterium indicum TaxID=2766954 RepID=A0ABS9BZS3_9FLAO|nr:RDD family protein [Chryseobacterium sp. PS-8]MCF2217802.1 RDD family protein [Chryseobacterium sp. PS-8]